MDSININEFNILILLKQRVFGFQLAVLPGFSMPTISLHSSQNRIIPILCVILVKNKFYASVRKLTRKLNQFFKEKNKHRK